MNKWTKPVLLVLGTVICAVSVLDIIGKADSAKHPSTEAAFQREVDAAMDESAADPGALPETRASITAAKAEFDSLVRLDSRLGTHEARAFFNEEVERSARVVRAMEALRK
jgi:hypothetical protein